MKHLSINKKTRKKEKRDRQMHVCTHLSRFALVSRGFPGRYAKKYASYCIIACVLTCLVRPKKISVKLALSPRFQRKNEAFFLFKRIF